VILCRRIRLKELLATTTAASFQPIDAARNGRVALQRIMLELAHPGTSVRRKEQAMAKWNKGDRPDVTPDQMYEIARMVADKTMQDEALAGKLRASNLILKFSYYDDERWPAGMVPQVTVDCTMDPVEITCGESDKVPVIEMTMAAFTAHLFWMQKLNLMSAITRGQIKAKGPIPKAMRLLPVLKPFYANYRVVLAELGRDDLLNFPPD
jgi:hypothetical protein